MRVVVVGSRDYPQRRHVERYIRRLPPRTTIVTGESPGVDAWARACARSLGMRCVVVTSDLGFDRLATAGDIVMAFWDGHSEGTRRVIESAHWNRVHVEIVDAGATRSLRRSTMDETDDD